MPPIPDKLRELCNDQIANELHASHLYLSMAAYFDEQSLTGCASFMQAQSDEEREHSMRFYDHLVERNARVEIHAIEDTPSEWSGARAAFEAALEHERKVTSQIEAIYDAAEDAGDRPLMNMLDWFIDEQVEEEKTFEDILTLFDHIGDDGAGVLEIDERLAGRDEGE